jgi:hypothetical protein
MSCEEAAFLSTAFGPDFLDKAVTRGKFIGAFQMTAPAEFKG